MTSRRVLITTDTVGGVWQYTVDLVPLLRARGMDLRVVTLGPRPSQTRRAELGTDALLIETDLPLDWTAESQASLRAASEELAAIAYRERVDLVHLHAPAFAGVAVWPAPVVSVAHSCVPTWWAAVHGSDLPVALRWRADATARGLRASSAVIAPSAAFAAALRQAYGNDLPVWVLHNARRVADIRGGPRERAVLASGRLWDEGKNIGALDRAAARISAPIYAAGPISGPNGARVSFANLRLLGVLDQNRLQRRLGSTMVYASPALYEPFGLGVLEAAMLGTALVLSDIPTFRELWDGAATFVDPDSDAHIASALTRLLDDPALAARMGGLARERARDYSLVRLIDGTERVHRAVLARPRLRSVA